MLLEKDIVNDLKSDSLKTTLLKQTINWRFIVQMAWRGALNNTNYNCPNETNV